MIFLVLVAVVFSTVSSDPSPGAVTAIVITSFPAGATTIVINGTSYTSGTFPGAGVTVPTDASGNPTQTITVDPAAATGTTSVTIPFVALDAAGVQSSNTGTAVVNFDGITLSGSVFDDANGLSDNTVNGTGTNAGGLNAVLVDAGTGKVVATTTVAADGTYSFTNQNSGNYNILITTNTATVGNAAPAVALPAGWVNTGEYLGTGPGSDGTVNGILSIGSVSSNVSDANFGIEHTPTGTDQSYVIPIPSLGSTLVLNGTGASDSPAAIAGVDAEDGILGPGNTFNITDISGLNGNQLFYQGVQITGPITISNYDPSMLEINFTGAGSSGLSFTYTSTDAAGFSNSTNVNYVINWTGFLPITLLNFSAKPLGNNVQLTWQTTSEINSSYFDIEYSIDGNAFKPIGRVSAGVNSAGLSDYSWLHTAPLLNGVNYYRLKMVDMDGQFTYSTIRVLKMNAGLGKGIIVYPNPVITSIQVVLPEVALNNSRLLLYNMRGELVKSIVADQQQVIQLEMDNLPNGTYNITIVTDNKIIYTSMVIKL